MTMVFLLMMKISAIRSTGKIFTLPSVAVYLEDCFDLFSVEFNGYCLYLFFLTCA